MDLAHARVVLRPRRLGELLDLALRWCLAIGGRTHLHLAALLLLPSAVAGFAVSSMPGAEGWEGWCVSIALASLVHGAFTVAAGQQMFAADVGCGQVLRMFGRRFLPYLGALVLSWIVVFLAVLTIFGLPWLVARIAFVPEAVLLENLSIRAAFRRSARLASRAHISVFVLLSCLAMSVLWSIATFAFLGEAIVGFTLQLEHALSFLWTPGGSVFAMLGLYIAIPFVVTARFLRYIDIRTRRDGWDVQVRFQALAMQAVAQSKAKP